MRRSYVRNRAELLGEGEIGLRTALLDIAEASLQAADPGDATRSMVAFDGARLSVAGRHYDLAGNARIFVVGAGKATYPIAAALEEILGDRIHAGLIVAKHGQEGALRRIEMILAGHPVPDGASAAGAERALVLLAEVRRGDLVIACFTGGSSALFVAPVEGVSLSDKAETSRILLNCGASIFEINAVRKHLSRVKGGNLARGLPAGARLINLTVSDVIGDRLDYVTDPTVPDTATFADAAEVIDRYSLAARLPASVVTHIRKARRSDETAREGDLAHLERQDVLLVPGTAATDAALVHARALGFRPLLLSTFFDGESRELGLAMAAIVKQVLRDGNPISPPCLLVGGGETIVRLTQGGDGGPNQEFAAAVATELIGMPGFAALGLDTDGTDGPTIFAGALVDGSTVTIARRLSIDLSRSLAVHNVTPALKALNACVFTGATGTNVNDLKLIAIGRPV